MGTMTAAATINAPSADQVGRPGEGHGRRLTAAFEALEAAEPFDPETVEHALRGVVERLAVKPRDVFQPVRVAISGTTVSPGIFESVAALGRDETLARIDAALQHAAGE